MAIRYGMVLAAGVVLAAGMGFGIAAGAAPAREGVIVAEQTHRPALRAHGLRPGARMRTAARVEMLRDPALATIAGLRAIERIYRRDGREEALPGYLRGVLARTGDPTVRNYVTFRLARIGMRGRDASGALRELERGVDENLERLR